MPLVLVLAGCKPRNDISGPISNDAYIWQRRWNSAVVQAVHESASSIRAWRVLAAEVNAQGEWLQVAVPRESLRAAQKPVIAVVRIHSLSDKVAIHCGALITQWKLSGIAVSGIEIDYDSGTNELPRYREFLRLLRRQITPQDTLSITALPSWLGSRHLPELLADVDESVLQVHSVMNAREGLFNRKVALEWAQKWSAQTIRPFLIALPTYWSRVSWNEGGRLAAIESETPRFGPRFGNDAGSQELFVEPGEVSSLVATLNEDPPPHLKGIAWFRLPTSQDQRAWSAQTWHSVIEGKPLTAARPEVQIRTSSSGVINVYLVNADSSAGRLPHRISISAQNCEFADALPPYAMVFQKDGFGFQLAEQDVLRAGQEKLVGWLRCTGKNVEAHDTD